MPSIVNKKKIKTSSSALSGLKTGGKAEYFNTRTIGFQVKLPLTLMPIFQQAVQFFPFLPISFLLTNIISSHLLFLSPKFLPTYSTSPAPKSGL